MGFIVNCIPWDAAVRDPQRLINGLDLQSFTSQHPGGVQFGFGDGSVRFVSETLHDNIQTALGSRHQGEVIDTGDL